MGGKFSIKNKCVDFADKIIEIKMCANIIRYFSNLFI